MLWLYAKRRVEGRFEEGLRRLDASDGPEDLAVTQEAMDKEDYTRPTIVIVMVVHS